MPAAYIHGDPVFSNIMLEKRSAASVVPPPPPPSLADSGAAAAAAGGSGGHGHHHHHRGGGALAPPKGRGVKFLDMRGALGDVLTTGGDVLYDLSKIFQSLNGYDFMLLDLWDGMTPTQHKQLRALQSTFWAAVAENYGPRRADEEAAAKGVTGGGLAAAADDGDDLSSSSLSPPRRTSGGGGVGENDERLALERAVASLRRDVTLLTAAHFFTIVPLHETRPRQLLYLQQSRRLLVDCALIDA